MCCTVSGVWEACPALIYPHLVIALLCASVLVMLAAYCDTTAGATAYAATSHEIPYTNLLRSDIENSCFNVVAASCIPLCVLERVSSKATRQSHSCSLHLTQHDTILAQRPIVQVLLLHARPWSQLLLSQQGRPCAPQAMSLVTEKVAAPPLAKLLPLAVRLARRGLNLSADHAHARPQPKAQTCWVRVLCCHTLAPLQPAQHIAWTVVEQHQAALAMYWLR